MNKRGKLLPANQASGTNGTSHTRKNVRTAPGSRPTIELQAEQRKRNRMVFRLKFVPGAVPVSTRQTGTLPLQ
jgi:hypothetical protein